MIKRSNALILSIPYLTICGVLYHIAFWDTFGLNGLDYISVSDIIKSAAYPVFEKYSLMCISMFLGVALGKEVVKAYITHDNKKPIDINSSLLIEESKSYTKIIFKAILLIILGIAIYYIYKSSFKGKWLACSYLIALPITIILEKDEIIDKSLVKSEYIRDCLFLFIIYLPFLSFGIGKMKSTQILNNDKYQYVTSRNINPITKGIRIDTMKYIGSDDKRFFFTDLHNSQILMIRSEIIDTLALKSKE